MRQAALAIGCVVVLAAGSVRAQDQGATEPFVVATRHGPVSLQLEIADEPAERQQGLMFRRSLPPRTGMLFDFQRDGPVAMWMKNTLIPLDMLFLDSGGVVVHIARRTEPLSEATISPGQPVRGVVELAGGAAESLGIQVGDLIARPLFATPP